MKAVERCQGAAHGPFLMPSTPSMVASRRFPVTTQCRHQLPSALHQWLGYCRGAGISSRVVAPLRTCLVRTVVLPKALAKNGMEGEVTEGAYMDAAKGISGRHAFQYNVCWTHACCGKADAVRVPKQKKSEKRKGADEFLEWDMPGVEPTMQN